ncbi:hypothetical protein GA0070617_5592 [Micromonospora yangpuensis]|uniref:Uncharacterized protein n=1 Tax=Micromonospora yangpuensis TaxID=683228 RepID=A0A1C6VG71_9ACTN|nr:hypothetical protein GA0070617_5592 [Micromonospora yangpuensis]
MRTGCTRRSRNSVGICAARSSPPPSGATRPSTSLSGPRTRWPSCVDGSTPPPLTIPRPRPPWTSRQVPDGPSCPSPRCRGPGRRFRRCRGPGRRFRRCRGPGRRFRRCRRPGFPSPRCRWRFPVPGYRLPRCRTVPRPGRRRAGHPRRSTPRGPNRTVGTRYPPPRTWPGRPGGRARRGRPPTATGGTTRSQHPLRPAGTALPPARRTSSRPARRVGTAPDRKRPDGLRDGRHRAGCHRAGIPTSRPARWGWCGTPRPCTSPGTPCWTDPAPRR